MHLNDPLGDMLTRIRNAQLRGKSTVRTPASKLRAWVLDVLRDEGYIRGYTHVTSENGHAEINIELKYSAGEPAIRELTRISKPGRRVCRLARPAGDRTERARRRLAVGPERREGAAGHQPEPRWLRRTGRRGRRRLGGGLRASRRGHEPENQQGHQGQRRSRAAHDTLQVKYTRNWG